MLTSLSNTGSPVPQAPIVAEHSTSPAIQAPRQRAGLEHTPRLTAERVEREALAERLEAGLGDLLDGEITDWSSEACDLPHIGAARAQPSRDGASAGTCVSPGNAQPVAT